jgi:hypothetical protein
MKDILICDPTDEEVSDMLDYCNTNHLSLVKFENLDVSDVSGSWDTIATFTFLEDYDALAFKLKYR